MARKTYRRLYNPVSMTEEAIKFQEEFGNAIEPVLKRWERKNVCSRDMENIGIHAFHYKMLFIHLGRQTPMTLKNQRKRKKT